MPKHDRDRGGGRGGRGFWNKRSRTTAPSDGGADSGGAAAGAPADDTSGGVAGGAAVDTGVWNWRKEDALTYRSAVYEAYYKRQGIVPDAEWPAFIAAWQRPLPITFRVNPTSPDAAAARLTLETHPEWSVPFALDDGTSLDAPCVFISFAARACLIYRGCAKRLTHPPPTTPPAHTLSHPHAA